MYLPGIILFNKIALSDKFIFVGHCQYESGSWQNRNQIRTTRLTVPVRHGFGQSINDAEIDGDQWRRKHLRAIELCYGKRPFFNNYYSGLEKIITHAGGLADLNAALIILCLEWLDIKTQILFSEDYGFLSLEEDPDGPRKTNMLVALCKRTSCDEYLSNEGARAYVDEAVMRDAGLTHRWQKFEHPIYDQGNPEFITNMSIIDLLFNCGPEAGKIVRACGSVA